jgi:hypothetical protein
MKTKRAGPERAFEREALKVSTRDSAFHALASAHSRTQGRNAQRTETPRLQPTLTNWRSSGASRRAPLIPVGPPLVQPPARSGAKAAFAFSSLSDTERPPGVLSGRRAASSPGRSLSEGASRARGCEGRKGRTLWLWTCRTPQRRRSVQGCAAGAGGRPSIEPA